MLYDSLFFTIILFVDVCLWTSFGLVCNQYRRFKKTKQYGAAQITGYYEDAGTEMTISPIVKLENERSTDIHICNHCSAIPQVQQIAHPKGSRFEVVFYEDKFFNKRTTFVFPADYTGQHELNIINLVGAVAAVMTIVTVALLFIWHKCLL